MRRLSVAILALTVMACAQAPLHPPSTADQGMKIEMKWYNSVAQIMVENKKTYKISDKASDMLWIEHVIERGNKTGTITMKEEREWVRRFYAGRLFNDPSKIPDRPQDMAALMADYAVSNPIEPRAEGNDVMVPHILVEAIENFDPNKPVYAATDANGWLVLGKSKANTAALDRTEMKRESNAWRAKGMRNIRFHPAQLKDLSLSNPFIGSNVSWAKIENVYSKWSERWFVDTSGSGPCLLVK